MGNTRETVKDYAARRKGLTRDEFVRKFPFPFLVEREHGSDLGGAPPVLSTMVVSQDRIKALMAGEATSRAGRPVVPVVKRAGNAYAGMVTIGRTANNDIVLDSPAVSKFHAHFSHDAASDTYRLADADATNGTFVNSKRLEPKATVTLRDGDIVAISQSFKFTYYSPGGFFDFLSIVEPDSGSA